jgi:fermentation-respiration switch protein FrsA (DUF1100 family)
MLGLSSLRNEALNRMLYFPAREVTQTPGDLRLDAEEVWIDTEDGERLHGWWMPTTAAEGIGHILFCHGNAGNVGDRVVTAGVLGAAGFDVLLFDYRGYGRSTGRPSERGTIRDGRAARTAMLRRPEVETDRVVLHGESLGGAVALRLAVEDAPAGLILQSTFTSVRDVARVHYPWIPQAVVPDAYPSLSLMGQLTAPLLVLHGEQDEIVPVTQGRALYEAASVPKRIGILPALGHNDLVMAGVAYSEAIGAWFRDVRAPSGLQSGA